MIPLNSVHSLHRSERTGPNQPDDVSKVIESLDGFFGGAVGASGVSARDNPPIDDGKVVKGMRRGNVLGADLRRSFLDGRNPILLDLVEDLQVNLALGGKPGDGLAGNDGLARLLVGDARQD